MNQCVWYNRYLNKRRHEEKLLHSYSSDVGVILSCVTVLLDDEIFISPHSNIKLYQI